MFIRKKLNRSGTTSIQVINKSSGYKVVKSFGSAKDPKQIRQLEMEARNFILGNQKRLFSFKTKEDSAIEEFLQSKEFHFRKPAKIVFIQDQRRLGYRRIPAKPGQFAN